MKVAMRLPELVRFALRSRKGNLIIASLLLAIFVITQYGGMPSFHQLFTKRWNESFNAYAGISTLAVAIFVWLGELQQDWRASLPNKLTVSFKYKGRLEMICHRADLANVSDARALALQIGQQMAGTQQLKFNAAKIRQTGGEVEKGDGGQFQRHYFLEIDLLALPEKLLALDESAPERIWQPPFDGNTVAVVNHDPSRNA